MNCFKWFIFLADFEQFEMKMTLFTSQFQLNPQILSKNVFWYSTYSINFNCVQKIMHWYRFTCKLRKVLNQNKILDSNIWTNSVQQTLCAMSVYHKRRQRISCKSLKGSKHVCWFGTGRTGTQDRCCLENFWV